MCLTLSVVYKLPLRQTQGLMRSIARFVGLEVPVPDFSTLSRRERAVSLSGKAHGTASSLWIKKGGRLIPEGWAHQWRHEHEAACRNRRDWATNSALHYRRPGQRLQRRGCSCGYGDIALYPRPKVARQSHQVRQASIQTAQPD